MASDFRMSPFTDREVMGPYGSPVCLDPWCDAPSELCDEEHSFECLDEACIQPHFLDCRQGPNPIQCEKAANSNCAGPLSLEDEYAIQTLASIRQSTLSSLPDYPVVPETKFVDERWPMGTMYDAGCSQGDMLQDYSGDTHIPASFSDLTSPSSETSSFSPHESSHMPWSSQNFERYNPQIGSVTPRYADPPFMDFLTMANQTRTIEPEDSPDTRSLSNFNDRGEAATTHKTMHRRSLVQPEVRVLGDVEQEFFPCYWTNSNTGSHTDRPTSCGRMFSSRAKLQQHLVEDHTARLTKAIGYVCQWRDCQRLHVHTSKFAQRSKLERHLQSHTGYKASKCAVCGKMFSTQQTLDTHVRTHTGEKPFRCRVAGCKYAAAQASQLTMHSRTTHTKDKPLKCDYPGCTARFAESSNLSKHKKIHQPEELCQCPTAGCHKTFRRPDQLRRHMKTHVAKVDNRVEEERVEDGRLMEDGHFLRETSFVTL